MYDLFQVPVSQFGVGVARGNHFTLFGEAEAPVDTPGRLGLDGTVGRTATPRHRPAAAVEDGQSGPSVLPRTRLPLILRKSLFFTKLTLPSLNATICLVVYRTRGKCVLSLDFNVGIIIVTW